MALDGRELPDSDAISTVLSSAAPAPSQRMSNTAKTASLASLLLIAEIVKSPWYAVENHYGLYVITILASVQALRFADSSKRLSAVSKYANLCLEHSVDLLNEAQRRGFEPDLVWAERDPMAEFDVMRERQRLVADCAATLILSEGTGLGHDEGYAAKLVDAAFLRPRLWGLAAVPALIVRYWAVCRVRAEGNLDLCFAAHLRAILAANLRQLGDTSPLASPYYNFTDCWAYSKNIRFLADDSIFSDSFDGRVWFARAMLFMLAKRNLKQTCKDLWPLFSLPMHEEPILPSATFFDSSPSGEGEMRAYTFHRKEWIELIKDAIDVSEGAFLEPFLPLAWLLAAYVAIVPYRSWTGVLMWLDSKLNATWYQGDGRPNH